MKMRFLGALVAAFLAVGACAGGTNTTPSSPPNGASSGEEVNVGTDTGTELLFDPVQVAVRAGVDVRLTFENRSTVPHNLTFEAPINAGTSTVVAAGASETLTFTAPDPGQYPFICTLHPGMDGTLIVEAG